MPTDTPQEIPAEAASAIESRIRETYAEAVRILGLEAANCVWENTQRRQQRNRGRPRIKEISPFEALILYLYDELKKDPDPPYLVRFLALEFFRQKRRLGWKEWQSPQALERKIRRLLNDREAGKLVQVKPEDGALPLYRRSGQ